MRYRFKVFPTHDGFRAQIYRKRGPFWVKQENGEVFALDPVSAERHVQARIARLENYRLFEWERREEEQYIKALRILHKMKKRA